jgi:hypothetical protein
LCIYYKNANLLLQTSNSRSFVFRFNLRILGNVKIQQVTMFIIFVKIDEKYHNMVIISDYLAHDTRFVYFARKIIIEFLRKEYHNLSKIMYVSDGATGYFTSKYSIFEMCIPIRSFVFY